MGDIGPPLRLRDLQHPTNVLRELIDNPVASLDVEPKERVVETLVEQPYEVVIFGVRAEDKGDQLSCVSIRCSVPPWAGSSSATVHIRL